MTGMKRIKKIKVHRLGGPAIRFYRRVTTPAKTPARIIAACATVALPSAPLFLVLEVEPVPFAPGLLPTGPFA